MINMQLNRTYRTADGNVVQNTLHDTADVDGMPWKGSDGVWRNNSGRADGGNGHSVTSSLNFVEEVDWMVLTD
jgi:hypothetical protein